MELSEIPSLDYRMSLLELQIWARECFNVLICDVPSWAPNTGEVTKCWSERVLEETLLLIHQLLHSGAVLGPRNPQPLLQMDLPSTEPCSGQRGDTREQEETVNKCAPKE